MLSHIQGDVMYVVTYVSRILTRSYYVYDHRKDNFFFLWCMCVYGPITDSSKIFTGSHLH